MEMEKQAQPPAYPQAGAPAQQPAYPPGAQPYAHPASPPPGAHDPYAQQQYAAAGGVPQMAAGQPQYVQQPAPAAYPQGGQPQMAYQQPQMQHQNTGGFAQPAGVMQFQTAMPLASLGPTAAPVDCPSCHQRAITNVMHTSGDCTHLWALGFCFFLCLPCIPYLIDSFKDVQHKCGKCGVTLATFKRSGGTQVHVFA